LAKQHLRPVLRLGSAGSGLNFNKAIIGISRVGEHAPEFKTLNQRLETRQITLDGNQCLIIVLRPGDLRQLDAVAKATIQFVDGQDNTVKLFFFPSQVLSVLGVVPDIGSFELTIDFVQARAFDIEVKDTPEARPLCAAGRRAG
jgi:hypothetical protein